MRHVTILRRLALLLIGFVFIWPLASQGTESRHILLRRVSRGDSTIYLLGSVHMAKSDFYPLNDYVEKAFGESNRLVVEVDMSRVDQTALQEKILSLGVLPPGKTLREELGDGEAKRLEDAFSELGTSMESFNRYQPWLVYTALAALDLAALGYRADEGVDLYFLGQAGGREIVELETADSQIRLMAGFSEEEQRALLAEYLDERENLRREIDGLFEAWASGDDEQMAALLEREMGGTTVDRRVEQVLLRERDAAMAVKIEQLLAKPGSSFVVVGAAHLSGTGGVVDILKKNGYSVSDIRG